jgi:hypothetical protein
LILYNKEPVEKLALLFCLKVDGFRFSICGDGFIISFGQVVVDGL